MDTMFADVYNMCNTFLYTFLKLFTNNLKPGCYKDSRYTAIATLYPHPELISHYNINSTAGHCAGCPASFRKENYTIHIFKSA